MSRLPITALREFSKKCGMPHLIVFALDETGYQHLATFGRSTVASGQAADFGNKMKAALGWPESLDAQPSRVRALQKRVLELEARLQDSKGPK